MRIEEYTAQELFELLNELDETDSLEAKSLNTCKICGGMV
jgi:hypothetical protein